MVTPQKWITDGVKLPAVCGVTMISAVLTSGDFFVEL